MPKDIPTLPFKTYKKQGWKSIGDWLGTGTVATKNREYRSFLEARKFVHSLGLKNDKEWDSFCKSDKKPQDIPATPERKYKNKGWKSIGDWLGTGTIAHRIIAKNWLPWIEAEVEYRKIAKKYGLKRPKDWKNFIKSHQLPPSLPKNPWIIYAKERVSRKIKK